MLLRAWKAEVNWKTGLCQRTSHESIESSEPGCQRQPACWGSNPIIVGLCGLYATLTGD
jgi:hypothetical protein